MAPKSRIIVDEDEPIKAKAKTDIPIPLEFALNKTALTINSNCGQCLHLRRMAYPSYKVPCIQRGIIDESKPCRAFNPNPALVKFTEEKHVLNVAKAMEELNPRELKLLASIMNREERTRKRGFNFGQTVYFRTFGGDFLSNYVKGKVISADKNYIHLQGVDGCVATLHHSSVLNIRQWKKKEFNLIKYNKIKDPNIAKYTKSPTKQERAIKTIIDKTIPKNLTADVQSGDILAKSGTQSTRTAPLDRMLIVR